LRYGGCNPIAYQQPKNTYMANNTHQFAAIE